MKTLQLLSGVILGFVFFTASTHGQLASRTELIRQKYDEDRARGLVALNQRYIEAFEKELNAALQSKKLEDANAIQLHLKELKKEIDDLKAAATGEKDEANARRDKALSLVGKTVAFPHNNDPTKDGMISFHEEGKAFWLGTGNQSVPREYDRKGSTGVYEVWLAGRSHLEYLITLSDDGKEATIKVPSRGDTRKATISRTR